MATLAAVSGPLSAHSTYYLEPEAQGVEGRQLLQAGREARRRLKERVASLGKEHDLPPAGTAEWSAMNRKRAELIRKKICGQLSEAEQELYERLQRHSLQELERTFPRGGGDGGREETTISRVEAGEG